MTVKVYVPRDSGALALGAEQVAGALRTEAKTRGLDVEIVRNGSRGLYWLEPMVEVDGTGPYRLWTGGPRRYPGASGRGHA